MRYLGDSGRESKRVVAPNIRPMKELLIHSWQRHARANIPPVEEREPVLLEGLSKFIDQLAEILAADSPPAALIKYRDHLAADHGIQRASLKGFPLDQLIWEFDLLRKVLFEELEKNARPLPRKWRNYILDAMAIATKNCCREFVAVREAEKAAHKDALEKAHQDLEGQVRERTREFMKSEQRFHLLVEGVKDYAIFTMDPRGFITTWNKGAARMKKYTAEEAIGQHYSMLYTADERRRDEPGAHLRTASIEGRFRGEGTRVRKTGELFLADVLITPMYEDQKLYGFSKVVADLTERHKLIQERDLSLTDLKRLQLERNERERFVATLTHDLRNPLSAAKAGAQMILRYPEKSPPAHRLREPRD